MLVVFKGESILLQQTSFLRAEGFFTITGLYTLHKGGQYQTRQLALII